MKKGITITNKPEISAIYYALLQNSYDFYSIEKDSDLINKIEEIRKEKSNFDRLFFSKV